MFQQVCVCQFRPDSGKYWWIWRATHLWGWHYSKTGQQAAEHPGSIDAGKYGCVLQWMVGVLAVKDKTSLRLRDALQSATNEAWFGREIGKHGARTLGKPWLFACPPAHELLLAQCILLPGPCTINLSSAPSQHGFCKSNALHALQRRRQLTYLDILMLYVPLTWRPYPSALHAQQCWCAYALCTWTAFHTLTCRWHPLDLRAIEAAALPITEAAPCGLCREQRVDHQGGCRIQWANSEEELAIKVKRDLPCCPVYGSLQVQNVLLSRAGFWSKKLRHHAQAPSSFCAQS